MSYRSRSTASRTVAVAAVVALGATGMVTLGAATAHADAAPQRVSVSFKRGLATQVYGKPINLLATTREADGDVPTATNDKVMLQRSVAGRPWQTIRTVADAGEFWQLKAKESARYRVQYSGGTETTSDGTVLRWAPDTSSVVHVKVLHKVTARRFRTASTVGFKGTVSPKYRAKVKYQSKKKGESWRTIRSFKLTGGTRYKVVMKGETGQKFRILVPGTRTVGRQTAGFTLITQWTA